MLFSACARRSEVKTSLMYETSAGAQILIGLGTPTTSWPYCPGRLMVKAAQIPTSSNNPSRRNGVSQRERSAGAAGRRRRGHRMNRCGRGVFITSWVGARFEARTSGAAPNRGCAGDYAPARSSRANWLRSRPSARPWKRCINAGMSLPIADGLLRPSSAIRA